MSEARTYEITKGTTVTGGPIDPADHRRGQDAIRSLKLLADWLRSQGYEAHKGESNAQFVGRVLRETIGKGGMP